MFRSSVTIQSVTVNSELCAIEQTCPRDYPFAATSVLEAPRLRGGLLPLLAGLLTGITSGSGRFVLPDKEFRYLRQFSLHVAVSDWDHISLSRGTLKTSRRMASEDSRISICQRPSRARPLLPGFIVYIFRTISARPSSPKVLLPLHQLRIARKRIERLPLATDRNDVPLEERDDSLQKVLRRRDLVASGFHCGHAATWTYIRPLPKIDSRAPRWLGRTRVLRHTK